MASPDLRGWRVGSVRRWQVWALQPVVKTYVVTVVCLDWALTLAGLAAEPGRLSLSRLGLYLALLCCAAITVESTRGIKDVKGTGTRDLLGIWIVTIAILFPPGFAFLAPLLIYGYWQVRTPRMFLYRRVFSAATLSLGAGAASVVFHAAPAAGPGPRTGGAHAVTWLLVAAGCALLSWFINNALVLAVIRLATPEVPLRGAFGGRTALNSDLTEMSIAVTVACMTALEPGLLPLTLVPVVLCQRYLMTAQLASRTRIDPESGALTAVLWRSEADVEGYRAQRTHTPLTVVLAEIDDFAGIREMAGPQAASKMLQTVAAILAEKLPPGTQVGRLHGGTFAAVLPGTGEDGARRRAERIRDYIAAKPVATESGGQQDFIFRPTVSVGVAGQTDPGQTMTDLIAMADAALAGARASGGNQVRAEEWPVPR